MVANSEMIANRYEVIKSIGQGGMADVVLALDTVLNRQVAIKLMRGDLQNDPVNVLRFEREAKAVADLSHPNIVEIYDIGTYNKHPYMVMEYVKGHTLKELLRLRGALDVSETVDIAKQMALAIGAAHAKGIIHRDIKSQNIIIKDDGTVKVMDFGIALTKDSLQLTQTDSVMGSVHYLAPELAKGEAASFQSDIYAMGIVIYEMLVGDVPFKDDTPVHICLKHIKEAMPRVRDFNPDIPQALENIVLLATAKNKHQRYSDCRQMYDALCKCQSVKEPPVKFAKLTNENDEQLLRDLGDKRFKGSSDTSRNRKIPKKAKRRKKKLYGLIIACFVMVGAIALVAMAMSQGLFAPEPVMATVPQVVGMNISSAKTLLEQQQLVLDNADITYQLTDDVEKGNIISITPSADTVLDPGSHVQVVVSSGIGVTMPDFMGSTITEVEQWANQYPHLFVSYVQQEDESVEPGSVIRQELIEPGTQFDPDTDNELVIYYRASLSINVPNLINWSLGDAENHLKEMGLTTVNQPLDPSSYSVDGGEEQGPVPWVVVAMDPQPGETYTQSAGNHITLYYYPE